MHLVVHTDPCRHARLGLARPLAVMDGDTITVEPDKGGERVKVRLHGIDAPEARQPYGRAAKDFVIKAVLFRSVELQESPQKRDRYGRTVAVVLLPGGESLQAVLLRAGLAWVWPRYCVNCAAWQAAQDEARLAGRGLWAQTAPVPPWEWRRR